VLHQQRHVGVTKVGASHVLTVMITKTTSALARSTVVDQPVQTPPTRTEPALTGLAKVADDMFDAVGVRFPSTGWNRTSVPVDAPWLGGVENATEIKDGALVDLEGRLPAGLRGTLFRNGPARFDRGGERVPHWFDGDGAILRVGFDGSGSGQVDYKFIRNTGYVEDEAAGRYTRPAFGYVPEGTPVTRSASRAKNTANTSVVPFGDRLLALYEGAPPSALDAKSLDTVGQVTLGALTTTEFLTAHVHRDADGSAFAFAYEPGPLGGASLLELGSDGDILRKVPFPALKTPPHDFISAGPFLVFVEPPSVVKALPAIVGLRSLSESITWNAHGKTRIHIVDKDNLQHRVTGTAAPFLSGHFGGGRFEEDGTISFIAFILSDNDPTGSVMARFARGERAELGGTPTRIHVDPKTGDIVQKVTLSDVRADWPVEDPREAGFGGTSVWCATQKSLGYFDGYAQLHREQGIVDEVSLPPGVFGNEPIVVVDADDETKRHLVTVQYDSNHDRSELVVYDADALKSGPTYRGALPSVVPFGFHGSFVPAAP
jgi:all-trans-8'-apo-beta-carotenal 15,15'-oxygenase